MNKKKIVYTLRNIKSVLMCPFMIQFQDYRVYGQFKQFRCWFFFIYFHFDY